MKPLSELLTRLIASAEDLMRKPHHWTATPSHLTPAFSELASEIRRIDALPCDGIRATRAGVIMCTAIEAFFAEQNSLHHWQMIIGATLPLLRIDAWQAMKNERAASEETRR
jgi:hypothetical protein